MVKTLNRVLLMKKFVILLALCLLGWQVPSRAAEPRIRQNFDFGWQFSLNNGAWTDVQLPHDWSITLPFDRNVSGSVAHLPGGLGQYRKTFRLPRSMQGKQVSIHFDGIFMNSDVWINGHHLGHRPYGFCSLEYDMTPYLNTTGDNELTVRVDRTDKNEMARWYAGSGIYRHVWLVAHESTHIATNGTYITTPRVTDEEADVRVQTTVVGGPATLSLRVLDADGKVVARSSGKDTIQTLLLKNPKRWSIDTPYLYILETTLKQGTKVVDRTRETFGVRTIQFTPDRGFLLNGERVKLKGLCLHQDDGSFGCAVPDRAYERRLEILKEYGCNALRMSHNQPSPELLDLCDRMGFVVIDEAFDKWKSGYYEKYFDEWWQRDMTDMLLRDRNHPSIILWSIGNELQEAWDQSDVGVERARMLNDFVHRFEPTRPTNLAGQNNHQGKFSAVVDVSGYNYLEARMLTDHKNNPQQCFVVTEELPYYSGAEGNIRSYTVYNPWNYVKDNDFIAGGFIWSGVDYLGESGWPSKGWSCGLFDICMNEKPRAAYHRAMWNDRPLVRIAVLDPSLNIDHGRDLWQWPNMTADWSFPWTYEGLVMDVCTITNCEEVELELNGKVMGRERTADYQNNSILWHIPFTPGRVVARGYNRGELADSFQIVTARKAEAVRLSTDRLTLHADGQDVAFISVQLTDSNGHPVQVDDRSVTVEVEGEGRFRGIDNGDLRRSVPFGDNQRQLSTYFGQALVRVQSTRQAGEMTVRLFVEGFAEPFETTITTQANS